MTVHHTTTYRPTIGRDFMAFGNEVIAVRRAEELREDRPRTTSRSTTQPVAALRHWLGGLMISCGSWLAGATTPTVAPVSERPLAPGR